MLARTNRLVRADDYRRLVRRGRRLAGKYTLVYISHSHGVPQLDVASVLDRMAAARFGFIVPKTVGVAVDRNLVRRRLKSICYEALPGIAPGTDIVIRALPGSAQAGWDTLRTEVSRVLNGVAQG